MVMWFCLIGALGGIPLILGLLLFLFQRRLLYPKSYVKTPDFCIQLPSTIEKIDYDQGYSLFLNAATHPDDARPVLIFAHGNAESAFIWSAAFDPILSAGISVLLLEYPGYAGAAGHPSYPSIKTAILTSYDQIVARSDVDASAVMAYGRSMGGGAVSLLADNRPLAALALECTFASLKQLVAEKRFPSFLLRDRYENADIVSRLDLPVFIYHGTEDTLIPIHHSEALAAAARSPTVLTGPFGHNNCPRPWDELLEFIRTNTQIALKYEQVGS